MIRNFTFFLLAAVAAVVVYACGYRSSENSSAQQSDADEGGTSVVYQLVAIEGQIAPDGGFYELDDRTGIWCELPSAADMMAYATVNGIDNPNDVPDLRTFFDKESTRLFNSCSLSLRESGTVVLLSLNYNGQMIYSASVNKSDIPAGGNHEIRVKTIKGFELPQADGSLLMENGGDYVISVGNEPAISFTNEWGEYLLKFRRSSQQGQ